MADLIAIGGGVMAWIIGSITGWAVRGWLDERRAYRRATERATRWDADYGIWMDTDHG